MKVNYILSLLFLILIMAACKKEDAIIPTQPAPLVKEFDSCSCSVVTGKETESFYIKADIDGVPVCFDASPGLGDTFPNVLRHGYILRDTGNQYYDNVSMVRNARNSSWQAAMFFENTHALKKTYPYQLPRANSEYCEIGELQLNSLGNYTSCVWCPENKFNYYAQFWGNGVKMTVNSFNNNVFEGIFSGIARTGSGKTVTITNGKFRMKLIVFKVDIKLTK